MNMPITPSYGSHPVHPDTLGADLVNDRLRALHDDYVEMTNMALAEGRDDLVQQLADRYAEEALTLMADGAHSIA